MEKLDHSTKHCQAKPLDYTWGTTNLVVSNVERSVEIYTNVFGFVVDNTLETKRGSIAWAKLRYNDYGIHVFDAIDWNVDYKTPKAAGIKSPVTVYLYCIDVENIVRKAKSYGLKMLQEPQIMFWGDVMCKIEDEDGYIWDFAKNVAGFDPSKMPF